MPCYNSEDTVESTIDSVLSQRNFKRDDIQFIAINDGSIDHTLDILNRYKKYIEIYTIINSGVSAARNYGLKYARGEFIQYVDSDDILVEDKLWKQINLLQNSNSDIAYGLFSKFYSNGSINCITETIAPDFSGRSELKILVDQWCPPACLLFKRSIVERIGKWNLNLPIIQDARYLFDAANLGARFVSTDEVVAYYRINNSRSLSSNNYEAFINDVYRNIVEIVDLWREDLLIDSEKKIAVIKVLRYCTNEFSKFNNDMHSMCINTILQIDPNYIPEEYGLNRRIAEIFGFRLAEKLAQIKRRLF